MKSDFKIGNVSRLANNEKVSDHFAIICTQQYAWHGTENVKIDENAKNVLHLVESRMLVSVSPQFIYDETKVVGTCEGYIFTGNGRKILQQGWQEIDKFFNPPCSKRETFQNIFPSDIAPGKHYSGEITKLDIKETKPPKPYTEAELLKAMEKAGNKEMADEVERKGLGTSSTRAEIIEILLKRKYIYRNFKNGEKKSTPYLLPCSAGKQLIKNVSDSFKNVDTTVEWENQLLEVEKGRMNFKIFNNAISRQVENIVNNVANDFSMQQPLGPCPFCGQPVKDYGESVRAIECHSCHKTIWRTSKLFSRNKILSNEEISKLLNDKSIVLYTTYIDKTTNKPKEILSKLHLNLERTKDSGYLTYAFDKSQ